MDVQLTLRRVSADAQVVPARLGWPVRFHLPLRAVWRPQNSRGQLADDRQGKVRQKPLDYVLEEADFDQQLLDEEPVFEASLGKAWSETLEMLALGR